MWSIWYGSRELAKTVVFGTNKRAAAGGCACDRWIDRFPPKIMTSQEHEIFPMNLISDCAVHKNLSIQNRSLIGQETLGVGKSIVSFTDLNLSNPECSSPILKDHEVSYGSCYLRGSNPASEPLSCYSSANSDTCVVTNPL
jgi:hypothetical protein